MLIIYHKPSSEVTYYLYLNWRLSNGGPIPCWMPGIPLNLLRDCWKRASERATHLRLSALITFTSKNAPGGLWESVWWCPTMGMPRRHHACFNARSCSSMTTGCFGDTPMTWSPHLVVSQNRGTPKIIRFSRIFHYKPSILSRWEHPLERPLGPPWTPFPDRKCPDPDGFDAGHEVGISHFILPLWNQFHIAWSLKPWQVGGFNPSEKY